MRAMYLAEVGETGAVLVTAHKLNCLLVARENLRVRVETVFAEDFAMAPYPEPRSDFEAGFNVGWREARGESITSYEPPEDLEEPRRCPGIQIVQFEAE